jgi:hypothetical protein
MPVRPPTRLLLAAVIGVAGVAGAVSVARAGDSAPVRPPLVIGGGILASPTSPDAYLVNMTIAPRSGELEGPMLVTACNGVTCHTARGGGSLPIVNVPFSVGHRAAGAHVTVDVAACSAGFRCVTAQLSGVVPAH